MIIISTGMYRCRDCGAHFTIDFSKDVQSPLLVQVGYHICDEEALPPVKGVGDLISFTEREQAAEEETE